MRPTLGRAALSALLLTLLLTGAGCGGGSTATPEAPADTPSSAPSSASGDATSPATGPATGEAADVVRLSIQDYDYVLPRSVPAGARLKVTNEDEAAHTFTIEGGGGGGVPAGASAKFTAPRKPGEYRVVCYFHGEMKGTLVVS